MVYSAKHGITLGPLEFLRAHASDLRDVHYQYLVPIIATALVVFWLLLIGYAADMTANPLTYPGNSEAYVTSGDTRQNSRNLPSGSSTTSGSSATTTSGASAGTAGGQNISAGDSTSTNGSNNKNQTVQPNTAAGVMQGRSSTGATSPTGVYAAGLPERGVNINGTSRFSEFSRSAGSPESFNSSGVSMSDWSFGSSSPASSLQGSFSSPDSMVYGGQQRNTNGSYLDYCGVYYTCGSDSQK